jgi:hypothetical protein
MSCSQHDELSRCPCMVTGITSIANPCILLSEIRSDSLAGALVMSPSLAPVKRSPCRSLPTGGGRCGSRTHKAHRSAVFGTAAVASRLALPWMAEQGGVEPPAPGPPVHRCSRPTRGADALRCSMTSSGERKSNPHCPGSRPGASCRWATPGDGVDGAYRRSRTST